MHGRVLSFFPKILRPSKPKRRLPKVPIYREREREGERERERREGRERERERERERGE